MQGKGKSNRGKKKSWDIFWGEQRTFGRLAGKHRVRSDGLLFMIFHYFPLV